MFSLKFLKDSFERATKTGAQAVMALISTDISGITDLDLSQSLNVAGLAILVSLLTSIISSGRDNPQSASWVKETEDNKGGT